MERPSVKARIVGTLGKLRPHLKRKQVYGLGVSIPQEALPHVFDRFYRVDPSRTRSSPQGGSGLGLSIAQGLVNAHGGTLCVSSVPGQGTKVTMRLPAMQAR